MTLAFALVSVCGSISGSITGSISGTINGNSSGKIYGTFIKTNGPQKLPGASTDQFVISQFF